MQSTSTIRAVLSPCIGICELDTQGLCSGCRRTTAEIARLPTATGELLVDDADDDDDTQRKEDPVAPPPVVASSEPPRGDMTAFDPQTAKFDRGDPTALRSISALRR